jgi:predicted transcriptional regulator of viral defense system
MKFDELLRIIEDEPVFETSLLLSGDVDTVDVQRQLSRWASGGRLYRLRRGLYAPAPPYGKVRPHPFAVANRLMRPSYVSLQSALAFHSVIPESVPLVTSVTTGRPGEFSTPLGTFMFRHVQMKHFHGFREIQVVDRQRVFVATPEKALLDLLYLERGSDSQRFIAELRLELEDGFDLELFSRLSTGFESRKVQRAVSYVLDRARDTARSLEVL